MANFTWGPGGQMLSPAQVASNRRTAAMLAQRINNPQTMWEGVQSAAGDIGGSLLNWQADQAQKEGESKVAQALKDALANGSDPSALLGVVADPWATSSQSAVAQALYGRENQLADQASNWAHEDSNLKQQHDWQINDPLRQQQLAAGDIELNQAKAGTHVMTADERAAAGFRPDDPNIYQVGPDGKVDQVNSGGGVTINTGDTDNALNKSLSEQEGKDWAGYKQAGAVSGANAQDFAVLDELGKIAPQGPVIGPLAETFKGFNSAGDAFQSIVKRIAPTLRAPGSGSTSDIEYQGMLDSLPSLKNSPAGNAMILSIMKAKAAINVARAKVITDYQNKLIGVDEARARMSDLNSQSIITPEMRQALLGIGAQPNGIKPPPQIGEEQDGYIYQGGDPSLAGSWKPK